MSNRQDIEPSLDFYELRRRHEAYKNSKRQTRIEPDADAPVESSEDARIPAEPRPLYEEKTPAEAKPAETDPEDAMIPGDSARLMVEDFADGEAAPQDDGEDGEDGEDAGKTADNPNPFDSFLRAFKGIRGRLGKRFGRGGTDDDDADDDEDADYEDDADYGEDDADDRERYEALSDEMPEDEPARIAPAPRQQVVGTEQADVEDVLESAPARRGIAPVVSDGDVPEADGGIDDGEEDDEDDEDEEERPERGGGFKRFLRLFVVPVDDEERDVDDADDEDEDYDDEDDGDDEDEDAPRPRRGLFRRRARADVDEDDEDDEDDGSDVNAAPEKEPAQEAAQEAGVAEDIEGGPDMSDLNNVNAELTNELAAELGTPGMSRRERRELALRQAAQKAAEGMNDEAQKQAGEAAQAVQAVEQKVEAAQEKAEAVAEKALEPDAVADVAEGIVGVQRAKDEYDAILDEPTREYKAVSKQSYNEFMEPQKDDDEDDEDEDEEEEEKPRRGLFGRRRRKDEEEDEDDDYDDEDDDEEEDEEEEERPRRGLFGRRRRKEEEDEDEDEDDEDDEDDDDYDEDDDDDEEEKPSRRRRRGYDDEYDEDDYDDDDYDDYDDYDDDDGSSFGHVLLGILKGFLTAVMLLLFVVVVLNVLNIFNVVSMQNIARRLPTRMVNVFLPSENMKKRINVEADADAAPLTQEAPAAQAPAEVAQPEAAQPEVVPIEEIPAPEAPAEEAPAEAAPAEGEGTSVG